VTETAEIETPKEELSYAPAQFRDDVTVKLMDMMGDEHSIVRRARVSVKGSNSLENVPGTPMDLRDVGLLKRLYRDEHGVPFEGVEFEIYIEAPLFTIQQMLKHRLSSINQSSGRYSEMVGSFYLPSPERPHIQVGKTMDYVFEAGAEWQQETFRHVQKSMNESWWHNYNAFVHEVGIAKELARIGCPHNIYASMYYKTNLRSLLNFLKLRSTWEESKRLNIPEDVRTEVLLAMQKAFEQVVRNGVDGSQEDFEWTEDILSERLDREFNYLTGGPRIESHPQYEIELIADEMAKFVKEKLPNVWEAFVKAGYYSV